MLCHRIVLRVGTCIGWRSSDGFFCGVIRQFVGCIDPYAYAKQKYANHTRSTVKAITLLTDWLHILKLPLAIAQTWQSTQKCYTVIQCMNTIQHCQDLRRLYNNKKAELSQRWRRDAPNIWVPWKFSGVPAYAHGYFSRNFSAVLFRSILWMCLQNLKFVIYKNCRRRQSHSHLMPPPRGTPANIRMQLIFPETSQWPRFLSQCGCIFTQKTHIFCARHWPECVLAVQVRSSLQGHPRSMILVPIESAYTTSY